MSRGLLPGIQHVIGTLIARRKGKQVIDARQNEAPVGELADG